MLILFDVLGTLLRTERLGDALRGTGAPGLLVDDWLAHTLHGGLAATVADRFVPFRGVAEATLVQVLAKHRLPAERASSVLATLAALEPWDDAKQCIAGLDRHGHRLAALTNLARADGEMLLHAADLHDRVAPVISADAVRAWKPHPSTYRHALAELGVGAGQACVVSAHAWDVLGAAAVGLRTVWVARLEAGWPFPGSPPDLVATRLGEVPDLLPASSPGDQASSWPDERPTGLELVDDALRAEDFPMDKAAVAYAVGDVELRRPGGRAIAVRDVLDAIRQERFETAEEATRCLRTALRTASRHDA